jgi:hypothetical protein
MLCNRLHKGQLVHRAIISIFVSSSLVFSSVSARNIPLCNATLLTDPSHFSIQEIYNTDTQQFELQIAPHSRFAPASHHVYDVPLSFYEVDNESYWALPFYLWEDQPGAADYNIHHFCKNTSDSSNELDIKRGFFSTMRATIDSAHNQTFDYSLIHKNTLAFIFEDENLSTSFVIRDRHQNTLASGHRGFANWEIDNPHLLPPELIGFILTHKLNARHDNTQKPTAPKPSIWSTVALAAGISAIVVGTAAITTFCLATFQERPPPTSDDIELIGDL